MPLVDEEIITAILGHAEYSDVPRESNMAKALLAVDELAGFIVACCKVRPNGIGDMEPASVKKLKDKAFAAAVSRDDIARGGRNSARFSALIKRSTLHRGAARRTGNAGYLIDGAECRMRDHMRTCLS